MIIDVQRAGPSTGIPTKPEQADLLLSMWGRNRRVAGAGDRRLDTGGCFDAAIEAARIALKYRTPVFLLSDAYLANGSEPWLIPDIETYPEIPVDFADAPNHEGGFLPYLRDAETLRGRGRFPARLASSIGSGLEKADGTGNVSYDPDNHDHMVRIRARKVAGIAADIPERWTRKAARSCSSSAGAARGPVAAGVRRVAAGAARSRRAPELSEPLPATPAMCCADTKILVRK